MRRLTQEEFIAKAVAVHGMGRYDYSQTVYMGSDTKVAIVCPKHGLFMQTAYSHASGRGCVKCGDTIAPPRLSQDVFLVRARAIHGDKYDYSQTRYTSILAKVTIICPEHGLFRQVANGHLSGNGCIKCGFEKRRQTLTLSKEVFLERARQVHGDKYDYSQVEYVSSQTKVTIICPEHGLFEQIPSGHLGGKGCLSCAGTASGNTESFCKRAHAAHGDKYDYSQVRYVNSKNKVIIICPQHGSFEQSPYHHYLGKGCADCAHETRARGLGLFWTANNWSSIQGDRTAQLYVVQLSGHGEQFFKVGITFHSLKERFKPSIMPYSVKTLALFSSSALDIHKTESSIKKRFRAMRYLPTKSFGGRTECYTEAGSILEFLVTQSNIQQIE